VHVVGRRAIEEVQCMGVADLLEPEQQRVERARVGRLGVTVVVEERLGLVPTAAGA
jgi:hypothetical protein